jgi:glycosyltransferase involved in cell wall biosynthesis
MDPLVSIVVPCYKLAHLLSPCVNSILKQDYNDFEVLIMDNCSPDDTPAVAQSFHDPRVKHIRNESNLGHIRNFNKGITLARGKYVWMMMADDMLRSTHVLGRYVDLMERNPDVGFVFCRAVELHGEEEAGICQWADRGDQDHIWKGGTFFHPLIEANCIVASSVLVRKECYPQPGPYQLDLPFASDWYTWCMIAMRCDVAYFAEPMVCVRIHEQSLTTLYSRDHARICIGDELSVLWHVGHQAELAGNASLRVACKAALIRRAAGLLRAGLKNETAGMSRSDFETILEDRIKNSEDQKDIRASVYTNLGDEQYWEGEREQASRSYRLALSASPGRLNTVAKYLLLRSGVVGTRVRQMFRRRRRWNVEVKYAK